MWAAVGRYMLDILGGTVPAEAEWWLPAALAHTAWAALVTGIECEGLEPQAAEDMAKLKLAEMAEGVSND